MEHPFQLVTDFAVKVDGPRGRLKIIRTSKDYPKQPISEITLPIRVINYEVVAIFETRRIGTMGDALTEGCKDTSCRHLPPVQVRDPHLCPHCSCSSPKQKAPLHIALRSCRNLLVVGSCFYLTDTRKELSDSSKSEASYWTTLQCVDT